MIQKPERLWWVALFVGWSFDFLFWDKTPGVSFFIFSGITLGAGLWLAQREQKMPSRRSLWLLFPILLFAAGTFFRREPMTTFTNYLLVLLVMAIFAQTFVGGRWLNYSLSDFAAGIFWLSIGTLAKPITVFWGTKPALDDPTAPASPPSFWRRSLPVLRGLLLAIPVLAVFAALLSAADPIFSGYIEDFVDLFRLEKFPEYLVRGVLILILAYLLSGVYAHALLDSRDEKLIGLEKPWVPRFLGFTEGAIVLGSVDALFAVFVLIQFRYFFGGQANIHINGYTYAEYARRGFGELVVVALFSLLLFLGLSTITRRVQPKQRKTFSGLGLGLMLLVTVMLVSAFRRLILYESAYGFTRLRSYSHIFMVWLGLLLAVVVLLELLNRQRAFALAALAAAAGFVLTLNILNVDGTIVRQNVRRAELGWELDANYLNTLSVDAVPALLNAYQAAEISTDERNEIAAILACHQKVLLDVRDERPWQSFHFGDARALGLLSDIPGFEGVQTYKNERGLWWVRVNDLERLCNYSDWDF